MAAQHSVSSTIPNPEQVTILAAANSKFAFDLYQRQTTTTSGNIFISPLSISMALAMAYLGAKNNTKTQMANVMKFNEVEEKYLHEAFSNLLTSLNDPDRPFKLYIADRLFGEKTYNFLDEFMTLSRKFYGAELAAVDFKHDSNGATAIINSWVAENTNNMIHDIIPPGALNEVSRLVLVNAIYFKGIWFKKFNKHDTKTEDFHVSPSESIKVELMSMRKKSFLYGTNEALNCQAIELPYRGNTVRMFILLPDKTLSSLSKLEEQLTVDALLNVETTFNMQREDVNLWIPRFRLDECLELSDALQSMGMGDAFSPGKADFSGIDNTNELVISKVLHRAVVEVNELGTEAAGVTAGEMHTGCAFNTRAPAEFRADHPFIFFIYHRTTESILFFGRVVKPEKASPLKDEQ